MGGRHHHHHHHHQRRPVETLSKLEAKLDTSSSIGSASSMPSELFRAKQRSRSGAKIAAVLIAAIIVAAALIGVVVYLINATVAERLDNLDFLVENNENDNDPTETFLDYQTYRDTSALYREEVAEDRRGLPEEPHEHHRVGVHARPKVAPEVVQDDQVVPEPGTDQGLNKDYFVIDDLEDDLFKDYFNNEKIVRDSRRNHRPTTQTLPPSSSSSVSLPSAPTSVQPEVEHRLPHGPRLRPEGPGRPPQLYNGQHLMQRRRRPYRRLPKWRQEALMESNSLMSRPMASSLAKARRLLKSFERFVNVAESETQMLRDLARNLTQHGDPVNVWTVLQRINSTLESKPDSALSRLMKRFYQQYYISRNELNDVQPNLASEASLSSLLFLSFGIFVTNGVALALRERRKEQGRRFGKEDDVVLKQSVDALKSIFEAHEDIRRLFPFMDDTEEKEDKESTRVNGFVRLLMNLMNAFYNNDAKMSRSCIWASFCHQLNYEANSDSNLALVARLQAVGMDVALKRIENLHQLLPALIRAIVAWEPINCQKSFPQCSTSPNSHF